MLKVQIHYHCIKGGRLPILALLNISSQSLGSTNVVNDSEKDMFNYKTLSRIDLFPSLLMGGNCKYLCLYGLDHIMVFKIISYFSKYDSDTMK